MNQSLIRRLSFHHGHKRLAVSRRRTGDRNVTTRAGAQLLNTHHKIINSCTRELRVLTCLWRNEPQEETDGTQRYLNNEYWLMYVRCKTLTSLKSLEQLFNKETMICWLALIIADRYLTGKGYTTRSAMTWRPLPATTNCIDHLTAEQCSKPRTLAFAGMLMSPPGRGTGKAHWHWHWHRLLHRRTWRMCLRNEGLKSDQRLNVKNNKKSIEYCWQLNKMNSIIFQNIH